MSQSDEQPATRLDEIEKLRTAIAALEGQRTVIGDSVVDVALKPLRDRLAALEAEQASQVQQLKYITILFTDIVGSTQISQHMDPEDIQAVMDGALFRFQDAIQKHAGRVLRFQGDGLKAIFGAPVSREDDPERAVRAGLELLAIARRYEEQLKTEWGIREFKIRVGINTGQVLLGGGVEADNAAMGMAVNLGARMESLAAPGCVLITHDTYRHVRGLFTVQALPPAKVKGSDELIRTYMVQGANERSFRNVTRGLESLDTPLVGRSNELSRLQGYFKTTIETGATQVITIVGEAGVGKSRLLQEFEQWIQAQPETVTLLKGRSVEQVASQPYSLLHSVFSDCFGILESDTLSDMRQKLEQGLSEYLQADAMMKAHFIGALSGYDFSDSPYLRGVQDNPQQFRDRALFYLAQYFNSLTQENPVVMFMDDIHWADGPSLDSIWRLSRECQHTLVVCLARHDLLEKRPNWGSAEEAGGSQHHILRLLPLTEQASSQLIDGILHKIDALPDALRQEILQNAEGNPYYIEEIIKNLIEESVLVKAADADTWQIAPARTQDLSIPPTLTALLQARLDRLAPGEKKILQQASTVGRIFWDAVLEAMRRGDLSSGQGTGSPPELQALHQRQLINRQAESAFAGTGEYSFNHSLLRDVSYRTVLKGDRQAYHRGVANWLLEASRISNRTDEYSAIIAGHFERAGDGDQAAGWYLRAGELARARFSMAEGRAFFERALELLPQRDSARRWRGITGLSETLGSLGESAARLETDRAMVALAQDLGDDQLLGQAYFRQGYYLGIVGDYTGERLAYENALAHAKRASDRELEALVMGLETFLLSRQGEHKAAALVAEEALLLAQGLQQEEITARTLINIGTYFGDSGDITRSFQLLSDGVKLAQKIGDLQGVASGLGNLGYYYLQVGSFVLAHSTIEQAIEQAQAIGYFTFSFGSSLNLGLALLREGQTQAALDRLSRTLSDLTRMGDVFSQAVCHTYLGLAHEHNREIIDAQKHFAEAWRALDGLGAQPYAMDALAGLARCDLIQGQVEKARQRADRVWEHISQGGSLGLELPILAYVSCARVYQASGDAPSTYEVLEAGMNDLEARAARITDPHWQRTYYDNFPEHGEIVNMWQQVCTA